MSDESKALYAMADALIQISRAIEGLDHTISLHTDENGRGGLHVIAAALNRLGTADACTPMGALEFLALQVKESIERQAQAMETIADAIRGD